MHDDKSFHARKCPGSRTTGVFTAGQLSKECPSMTSVLLNRAHFYAGKGEFHA